MAIDQDAMKRAAAAKALEYLTDGMKLGLGTGTTAEIFLEFLAARVRGGLNVIGVPTSERTAEKARSLGIPLASLDDQAPLDLTIDGADEADRKLNLLKGAGGALLREKIVAMSSKRMMVIADKSKLVSRLGKFPLPVEVLEFGQKTTAERIRQVLAKFGYSDVSVTLRSRDGLTFVSDSGNLIYDCALNAISSAPKLAAALADVPGVVEHGLFIGVATTLIIAHPRKVEVIERDHP
ncbi:MAG TPA: ribose-5-phosphate isomerase RpiA [Rhizomicrobium sp.]|jgi:ribose 5-phosphate isomerase A